MAQIEAQRDRAFVGVEHLLVAMLQEGRNVGALMMQGYGLTVEKVRKLQFGGVGAEGESPSDRERKSPNDPKLSDGGGWRGPCMVGGKAAVEARAVTAVAVRCSAWLGVAFASD